jgi:hypothetical protein
MVSISADYISIPMDVEKQDQSCSIAEFDRQRMEYALSTEEIELPRNLTREEKRQFFLKIANNEPSLYRKVS